MKKKIKSLFKRVKVILTDCDGVLTDGGMYYTADGDELKKFSTYDGMAVRLMREQGYKVGIVTGENTEIVRRRAEKLKMDYLLMGSINKLEDVIHLCENEGFDLDEVAYIGDDINDRKLLEKVLIGACPKNAHRDIKRVCDIRLKTMGGSGALRELYEKWIRS